MYITFVFSCYKMFFLSWYKKSWSLPLFAQFLAGPFLFSPLQSSLWVPSWLTLQYLATPAKKNLCVPATSTQAERVFSWMEWLLKKEGFVCQENLSTCNYSWRTVLGFRLLLSLRCVLLDQYVNTKIGDTIFTNNKHTWKLLSWKGPKKGFFYKKVERGWQRMAGVHVRPVDHIHSPLPSLGLLLTLAY